MRPCIFGSIHVCRIQPTYKSSAVHFSYITPIKGCLFKKTRHLREDIMRNAHGPAMPINIHLRLSSVTSCRSHPPLNAKRVQGPCIAPARWYYNIFSHISSQLSTVKRCHTSGTRLTNREEQHASTCLINSFSLVYLYRPNRQTTHTMSKLRFALLSRMLIVCLHNNTHCNNTTYLLSLDTIQCISTTLHMYNLLHLCTTIYCTTNLL